MQRYFLQQHLTSENEMTITGEDYHHIVRVMRMTIDDKVLCVTTEGKVATAKIVEITDETVLLNVVQWEKDVKELPVNVTIASGLPKGDKLELVLQKGTELGAYQFIPFNAARSVVKWDEKKGAKKVERWSKIVKEAAEQSHRTFLPSVQSPVSFKTLVQLSSQFDYKIIAYEEEAKQGESSHFAKILSTMEENQSLLIVFGPEGGLSPKEVEELINGGFISCGLGPRILRTETAPLYALSAVSYHFELMR